MSHSDLCGRCHQQRRVHIDTVAGLLCPTARFQAPAPRAPEPKPGLGDKWMPCRCGAVLSMAPGTARFDGTRGHTHRDCWDLSTDAAPRAPGAEVVSTCGECGARPATGGPHHLNDCAGYVRPAPRAPGDET